MLNITTIATLKKIFVLLYLSHILSPGYHQQASPTDPDVDLNLFSLVMLVSLFFSPFYFSLFSVSLSPFFSNFLSVIPCLLLEPLTYKSCKPFFCIESETTIFQTSNFQGKDWIVYQLFRLFVVLGWMCQTA